MAARTAGPVKGPDAPERTATFVLGKGGTGKTVLAQGLAAREARSGEAVLLVRLGESVLEGGEPARTPTRTRHGYDVVDLEPRFAMDEYVRRVVRVGALADRVTSSDIYRKFFAAAPGLPELVTLGRIRAYAREKDRANAQRWSRVIVDCPSSGNGLLMLETPFAARRAVPVGPFAELASQIMTWLEEETEVALVAIPEEMAVVESIEFRDDLASRTAIPVTRVFLNRMVGEKLSAEARRALAGPDADLFPEPLVQAGRRALRRARIEAFQERRLARGLGLRPILLPELANVRPETVAIALERTPA